MPALARKIILRLLHDGQQPGPELPEPLTFGLQTRSGIVQPGVPVPDGLLSFTTTLVVGTAKAGHPILQGVTAHGPPSQRFLYLSWKRRDGALHLWGWRIKIPLALGWPEIDAATGAILTANVVGRRPHRTAPVDWRVEPAPPPP